MSSHAEAGKKAIEAGEYDEAVAKYTTALAESKSPIWLIQRATAYQRLSPPRYDLALADAEAAVHYAVMRGKRELIATGQFRRAMALYKLERFGDARRCLNWAHHMNDKEKGLTNWMKMVTTAYEECGEDDPKCQITVREYPGLENFSSAPKPAAASTALSTAQTTTQKIRHEWYQSSNSVTISIMAKGIPEDYQVNLSANELEVFFPIGESGTYDLTISPLYGEVDIATSTYKVMSTKLEITLSKAVPGVKWATLENKSRPQAYTLSAKSNPQPYTLSSNTYGEKPPAYPTSSKNGPKNWDAMKSFTMTDDSGKTEKIEIKDDDIEEGDELNGFFKKLYKDSNEDTRRAMMKSYQESHGTSLSTNWADVGSKSFKPENDVD